VEFDAVRQLGKNSYPSKRNMDARLSHLKLVSSLLTLELLTSFYMHTRLFGFSLLC